MLGLKLWWINMKIIDANIILRYLLNDHDELSGKAATIIEDNKVLLLREVMFLKKCTT